MSLSPIKLEILQSMLLLDKPMKAMDIAKDAHKEFQPVMMHLLGLQRMGYVSSPEKGLYVITAAGKKALGIPEITKEKATSILAYAPHDKSFHFYATVGKPLSMHAHNLRDFVGKIEKADIISVEFHFKRGDFENWFKGLGDEELVKKTALLKQRNVSGEALRKQLHDIVEQRYRELAQLTGQVFPEDQAAPENEHVHAHTHEDGQTHEHPHTHPHGGHVQNHS
ncbi:MAG: DUF5752 family protein [Candidatus Bathyarchaeota archaeon]|nr:DUF5752 family protein [Candidatus Bathyarchaeota archaeon]